MSSINKSGTRFTPKIGSRRLNTRPGRAAAPAKTAQTPKVPVPTTKESVEKTLKEQVPEVPEVVEVPAVVEKEPTKEKAAEPVRGRRPSVSNSSVRTPSVSSRRSSVSLRRPSFRRSSEAQPLSMRSRRLSSLSTSARPVHNRKSSTAHVAVLPPLFAPSRRGSTTEEVVAEIQEHPGEEAKPVKITIPLSAPARRRRSSLARVPRRRQSRVSFSSGSTSVPKRGAAAKRQRAENKKQTNLESDTEADAVKKNELELTPAELKAKAKYYFDGTKGKLVKVRLDDTGELPALEGDTIVIDSASQLQGIHKADNHELLEKFVINEKKMSMRELCKPFLPIGRVSRDYGRAMEGDRLRQEKRVERSKRRRLARRMRLGAEAMEEDSATLSSGKDKVQELLNKEVAEEEAGQRMVPTLVTDEQGNVTYSHDSTYVDRHQNTTEDGDKERVVENPYENLVTSGTYSKRKFVEKWTAQEMAEFYKALSMWGTDFGLIAKLFPYRTRRQVKAKFNQEERRHPHLVEFALLRKLPVDISEYSGKTGKTYKSLDEYNAEIEQLKLKHDQQLKKLAAAKEQARVEDLRGTHKPADLPTRVTARSRKAVLMEFRKNEEVVGSLDGS